MRIVSWQRAILLWLGQKIEVVDTYEVLIHSPSLSVRLPSVIKLKKYVAPRRHRKVVRFSRNHVFMRDDYTCQYCFKSFSTKELTLDHVIPVTRGGLTTWSNIVTCCAQCNQKKGCRTPQEAGFAHFKTPLEPKISFLPDLLFYKGSVPQSWRPYLNPEDLSFAS
jgi:5-methylcytosine-specific restriction endonuclease McrA